MTTILGIKALDGVVLFSDTQLTTEDDDGAATPSKELTEKILSKSFWGLTYAGTSHERLMHFFESLKRPTRINSHPIYKAVKSGKFPEIMSLNDGEMKDEDTTTADLNVFLLATRRPRFGLYRIDEFGNLHSPQTDKIEYVALGSGRKYARNHIVSEIRERKIDFDNFDLEQASLLAYRAFMSARDQDLNTGGTPDIALLTKKGVFTGRKYIEDFVQKAEERAVKKFISRHL